MPVPEAERCKIIPRDRQTVPHDVRVADDDPHLVAYERQNFRFPKIVHAYRHVDRPIVQAADVQHHRNGTRAQHDGRYGNVVYVSTAIFYRSGVQYLI